MLYIKNRISAVSYGCKYFNLFYGACYWQRILAMPVI